MLIEKIKKYKILLLICSGFLTSLTLAIPDLGIIQWITLVPVGLVLFTLFDGETLKFRKLYSYGLIFFFSFYVIVFLWFLQMYPMSFIEGMSNFEAGIVVAVAWLGLASFQTVGMAFIFPLFGKLFKCSFVKRYGIAKPFILASIWVVFEWGQTIGWWGVPWGRMCLGQVNYLINLQSISLFGSYFVSFLILVINFLIAYALLNKQKVRMVCNICAALVIFNVGFGAFSLIAYEEHGDKITVAAIQGNVSSKDKWEGNKMDYIKEVYAKYTLEAAAAGADLVVWPETALPYNVFESENLTNYLSDLAKEANVTILASVFTEGYDGDYTDNVTTDSYNTVIEVKPDGTFGETMYFKRHLVPFGEFVPMRDLVMFLIPPLANLGMLEEDIIAGTSTEIMDTEVGKIGAAICFDTIYEHVMLEAVRDGAEIICVSTNDSWFLDSFAVEMHNSQSKLRAIETGRYVVRSANTGISSIITPQGESIQELEALVEGYIIDDVYTRTNTTLYSVIGNLFVYSCMVFLLVTLGVSIYMKKRELSSL